jgi:hypothetical protein
MELQRRNLERNRARCREWYARNREYRKAQKRLWRKLNPEKALELDRKYRLSLDKAKRKQTLRSWRERNRLHVKEYERNYCKKNKDKILMGYRERRLRDPLYRLRAVLRNQLRYILKRKSVPKKCSVLNLIGCSVSQLKLHIESLWKEGMTWENHGKWHIDHIRPCISFDFSDPAEQAKCFHFSNLQPLWAEENQRKSGKYEET